MKEFDMLHRAALAAALCLAGSAGAAEPLPRLEAGIGVATLVHPDYRGSSRYNLSAFPLPYVIYRGDVVRVTREGLRAQLLDRDRLNLTMSAALSLPGGADGDSARRGMPRLMPTFEAGPSLDWSLHEPDSPVSVRLRLPVRAVVATDFRNIESAGWLAHPHLQVDRAFGVGGWTLNTGASAGPLWATRQYHAYFYEVAPRYESLPERPAYAARGGYSGTRAVAFVTLRKERWRVGIGLLSDWLDGAAFEDSPLVETQGATVLGIGVSYRLWARDDRVADDGDIP